jgi:hypothetical protein
MNLQEYAKSVKKVRDLQKDYFKYKGKRFELLNLYREAEKELDEITSGILNPVIQTDLFKENTIINDN